MRDLEGLNNSSFKKKFRKYTFRRVFVIAGRLLLVAAIAFIALLLISDEYIEFRENDHDLDAFFQNKQIPAAIGYYSSNGRKLRYLSIGNKSAPASILFLHGAPSSMSYFKPYFSNQLLLQDVHMLSVDRPGYGYSGLGAPVTSIEMQAKMIRPLLDSLQKVHHPLIIVAASYGTTVACRIAMDYPHLVDGMVLIAPSLAPGEEKIFPVAYLAENPLVKWAVPKMLVSANAEKLSHQQELQKMLPYWKNITSPVIYLQGSDDGLIYPSNAVFARKKLVNAACLDIYMIPGRGHLIAFLEFKRINKAIQEMLQLSKDYALSRRAGKLQQVSNLQGISAGH
jgi:pimeloyl-ACP methyl ester carboxylesterase